MRALAVYYRETKENGRIERISIETDHQWKLEFLPILYSLPEFMHQRQCEVTEKPISIAFDAQVSTAEALTENETVEEAQDQFDESSDEEVDDDPEVSTL